MSPRSFLTHSSIEFLTGANVIDHNSDRSELIVILATHSYARQRVQHPRECGRSRPSNGENNEKSALTWLTDVTVGTSDIWTPRRLMLVAVCVAGGSLAMRRSRIVTRKGQIRDSQTNEEKTKSCSK